MATNEPLEEPFQHETARRRNPRGQGERLRTEILDAADAVLARERDASKLTLRAVAKQAGISAPSVYLCFPDIDMLKIAVAERGFAELSEARTLASEGIDDPQKAMLAREQAYVQFALAHPGRYRLMFGAELPPSLAYTAEHSPSRRALQELTQSIEQCQEAGLVARNASPLRLATLLWVSLHGIVILRIDRPHFPWPPLDGMVDEVTQRLLGFAGACQASD